MSNNLSPDSKNPKMNPPDPNAYTGEPYSDQDLDSIDAELAAVDVDSIAGVQPRRVP